MPEGPEVRVVTDQLSRLIDEYPVLVSFEVIGGRYYNRHPFPNLTTFTDCLEKNPLMIKKIGCIGKLIYWIFSSPDNSSPDWYLLNTLGMSGGWGFEKQKHSHVEIKISRIDKPLFQTLWFTDIRRFATLTLTHNPVERFQKIGPDWLDSIPPSLTQFRQKFLQDRKKDKTLPVLLMDQSLFSGCGNYLKAEVLYRSKLSPFRTPASLSPEEWNSLYTEMLQTIRESYHANGTTIATYKTTDGHRGNYYERLKVYNQKIDPLGYQVVKIQTADKRTTHWVPEVQK